MLSCRSLVLGLGLAATLSGPCGALTLGQVDTFQGLGTAGWTSGPNNASQPGVVTSGGPAGAGDGFLQLASTGVLGPGGKLVGINAAQWAGDYLAAGISAITLDLDNFGSTELVLRLAFVGTGAVTDAVILPAGSGWTPVRFEFNPALLTAVTDLRLFHGFADSAVFPGPNVAALLGVDNITAVPEPAAFWLLMAGLATLGAWRQRRKPV